ncbi:hypothetical protein BDP27DRAFT_1360422 [Rhodocollybia butyracea]|uniref:C2H2-type domain-containing protein n=1 Tax=Rhodocollybia butyracea TaxID=206335 RepID=A0A9P5Q345_9AGAR|nr:hypothetical protein BDP27DRAFT_1360422 [Rhodocollybia butyracea]
MPRIPSCPECGTVLARRDDMRQHMHAHGLGMTEVRSHCPWPNCVFTAIQTANLDRHFRIHIQDKCEICPDCFFKTCDPAALVKHRKRIHGYVPKARKPRTRKIRTSASSSSNSTVSSTSSESVSPTSPTSSESSINFLSAIDLLSNSGVSEASDTLFDKFIFDFDEDKSMFNLDEDKSMFDSDEDKSIVFDLDELLRLPPPLFPAMESTNSLDSALKYHIPLGGHAMTFSYTGGQDFQTIYNDSQNDIIGVSPSFESQSPTQPLISIYNESQNDIIGASPCFLESQPLTLTTPLGYPVNSMVETNPSQSGLQSIQSGLQPVRSGLQPMSSGDSSDDSPWSLTPWYTSFLSDELK